MPLTIKDEPARGKKKAKTAAPARPRGSWRSLGRITEADALALPCRDQLFPECDGACTCGKPPTKAQRPRKSPRNAP